MKKGSESTGLFKTRLDLSSIHLILGQVWICMTQIDRILKTLRGMKAVTNISVEIQSLQKENLTKLIKTYKKICFIFRTFNITNNSQSFTRKSHIESPC